SGAARPGRRLSVVQPWDGTAGRRRRYAVGQYVRAACSPGFRTRQSVLQLQGPARVQGKMASDMAVHVPGLSARDAFGVAATGHCRTHSWWLSSHHESLTTNTLI